MLRANPREPLNRLFGLVGLLWTASILSVNIVSLSIDRPSATLWNRAYVFSTLAFLPVLVHFALVFPHPSNLARRRGVLPLLYAAGLFVVGWVALEPSIMIGEPTIDQALQVYSPNPRPAFFFLQAVAFTYAVLFLTFRHVLSDLDVTRKRLYFVVFGLSTYWIYESVGDLHLRADPSFVGAFQGPDATYWQLTLAADAFLFLCFFGVVSFLAAQTQSAPRRREAVLLLLAGVGAAATGFFDPILSRSLGRGYPGTLWLWRLGAVSLIFYGILKYQLFDLHGRVRRGVRAGTRATLTALGLGVVFVVVSNVVEQLAQDTLLSGFRFDYIVAGFVAAAVLWPLQRGALRLSERLGPHPPAEDELTRHRLEVYRAALEGALTDRFVSTAELQSLRNLRAALGLTEADHARLEADIRTRAEAPAA